MHHAFMICSNCKLQSKLYNICSIMFKNGYPYHAVDSAITRKLQNFKRPVKFGPSKCLVYLLFSWLATISTRFEKITPSVCCCYFAVEPNFVFTTRQLLPAAKKDVFQPFLSGTRLKNRFGETSFFQKCSFQHSNFIYQYFSYCSSRYVGTDSVKLRFFRLNRTNFKSQMKNIVDIY